MRNKYIILSSAYNEKLNIERTIKSVIKQTLLPAEWIIVNDGSTDGTEDIVTNYAQKYEWIKLYTFQKEPVEFGTHAVVNFYKGLNKTTCTDWDFVVKLDTDLDIDSNNFFELQLERFHNNPKLGISSGITYSIVERKKVLTKGRPKWRTGGAMKMYRNKCLSDIGGLKPIYGWDGLDEYQAMFNGWETRTFFDLHVNHLGKERANNRENEIRLIKSRAKSFYRRGYPIEFVLLKGLSICSKSFKAGISFYKSYFKSIVNNDKVFVSKKEKRFIRKFQYQRLFKK